MNKFLLLVFPFLTLLCGCHYHFGKGESHTITVPYAKGDYQGQLTNALIRHLAKVSPFQVVHSDGELCLDVQIVSTSDDRIGYRYDRRDVSGALRKNLVATESRKIVRALVTLKDSCGNCLFGPVPIDADIDYDYADQNSLRDLSLVDAGMPKVPSIDFSLGQLDVAQAASLEVFHPVYEILAQKIISGILSYYGSNHCNKEF